MPLSKEQLLIPRVMCIGGKEGNPNDTSGDFITGSILTFSKAYQGCLISTDKKYGKFFYTEEDAMNFLNKYPHLFRPMPWWEGRKPEDMPEYLKHGENGRVRKVRRYYPSGNVIVVEFEGGRTRSLNEKWVPSDEQEYWDSKPLLTCPDCGSTWKKGDDRCPECFPI